VVKLTKVTTQRQGIQGTMNVQGLHSTH